MTISLVTQKGKESSDASFAQEVRETSQAHLERCYQCVACSSGCPVAFAMDYAPHQVLRMTQLGLKNRVLDSTTIWLCASCETCAARCPNEINIVQVMDTLRSIAIKEGRTKQTKLLLFHNTFLDGVKRNGRLHELILVMFYLIGSGDIFDLKGLYKNMILGAKMFTRGRLAILPNRIKGRGNIKRIFQLTKNQDGV